MMSAVIPAIADSALQVDREWGATASAWRRLVCRLMKPIRVFAWTTLDLGTEFEVAEFAAFEGE